MQNCLKCSRPLRSVSSLRRGIGPVCVMGLKNDVGIKGRLPKGWSALTDIRVQRYLDNPFVDSKIPTERRPLVTVPASMHLVIEKQYGELARQEFLSENGETFVTDGAYEANEKAFVSHSKNPKIQALFNQLNEQLDTFRDSDKFKKYLRFVSAFRKYSLLNTMLIYSQRPDARAVAGFNTWKRLGRYVNKGEHAIEILAPQVIKEEVKDSSGNVALDENGKPRRKDTLVGFKVAHIFDISQTSGEEPPRITEELETNRHEKLLKDLEKVIPIPVHFAKPDEMQNPNAYGYYRRDKNDITVRTDVSVDDQVNTLIHEYAHYLLHKNADPGVSKSQREVEAESVAYVVAHAFELDTSKMSIGYISTYQASKPEILKKSMERIIGAANTIIDDIESLQK